MSCFQAIIVLILAFASFFSGNGNAEKGTGSGIQGTGPVFIVEPPSKVDFIINRRSVVIDCLVHGDPEPTVTWHSQDGRQIVDGSRSPAGIVRILTNNSLSFSPSTSIAGNGNHVIQASVYRCKAKNKYGTVVSGSSVVNAVSERQEYNTQVYDEYVIKSNTVIFTCHIPSYISDYVTITAWIKNDRERIQKENFQTGDKYMIDQNGQLYISDVGIEDDGSIYKCESAHKVTQATQVSQVGGKLHVKDPSSGIPPRIVKSISEISASVGDTIVIPCVGHGNPAPTYRWCVRTDENKRCKEATRQHGLEIGKGYLRILVRKRHSGAYVCKAENSMGQEEAMTKLTVYTPISAFIHPQIQRVEIGQEVSLKCVSSGGPIESVQWFRNGILLKDSNGVEVSSKTVDINEVTKESAAMYQCFVGNRFALKQASGQLILTAVPPELTEVFKETHVQPEVQVRLKCAASGDPLPSIKWFLRDHAIKTSEDHIHINTEVQNDQIVSVLSISRTKQTDGGVYRCTSTNKIGQDTHQQMLQVYGPPFVWPLANRTVQASHSFTLQCHYSGFPVKAIKWSKDGKELEEDETTKIFKNGTLLIASANPKRHQGKYECTVTNNRGYSSSNFGNIKIIEKPVIGPFMAERVHREGDRIEIHCFIVKGEPPIDFSWYFNGKPIPHQLGLLVTDSVFSSSIIVSEILRKHSGNYTCKAENQAGATQVSTTVKVEAPPEWVHKPTTKSAILQESMKFDCSGEGFPAPFSKWQRIRGEDSMPIKNHTSQNMVVYDNGTLWLNKVTEEETQYTYVCTVSNDISPDLVQKVQIIVETNRIIFSGLKNNFQSKVGKRTTLSCAARGAGILDVQWMNGSQVIGTPSRRITIRTEIAASSAKSSLTITKANAFDSGLYTCKVSGDGIGNSTHMYLAVEDDGAYSEIIKNNENIGNRLDSYGTIETSHKTENSSEVKSNGKEFLLSGTTLLYIIPTTTAAIVLLVILILVCFLLHVQRKKNISRNKQADSRSINGSTLPRNTKLDDRMSTMSNSSDRYYKIKQDRAMSLDDRMYASDVSTYPRCSQQIQPYATFTSDVEKQRKYSEIPEKASQIEMRQFD